MGVRKHTTHLLTLVHGHVYPNSHPGTPFRRDVRTGTHIDPTQRRDFTTILVPPIPTQEVKNHRSVSGRLTDRVSSGVICPHLTAPYSVYRELFRLS